MGAGMVSERDPASRRRAATRARQSIIRARLVEGVLRRRAKGLKVQRIATEMRQTAAAVRKVLRVARARGEVRALTDREAAAAGVALAKVDPVLAAEITAGDPTLVDVAVVVDPAPVPAVVVARHAVKLLSPSGSIDPARLALDPVRRADFVAALRAKGGPIERLDPPLSSGRAHLHHLADLYEHCAGFYPSVRIVSDGLTARRYTPVGAVSFGNAGLACAEA